MKKRMESDRPQGGDVQGTTKIDVTAGEALDVARASFDPGYRIGAALEDNDLSMADVVRGFCDYGLSIGETKRGR